VFTKRSLYGKASGKKKAHDKPLLIEQVSTEFQLDINWQQHLPYELWLMIVSHLNVDDLVHCGAVSCFFNMLAHEDQLWRNFASKYMPYACDRYQDIMLAEQQIPIANYEMVQIELAMIKQLKLNAIYDINKELTRLDNEQRVIYKLNDDSAYFYHVYAPYIERLETLKGYLLNVDRLFLAIDDEQWIAEVSKLFLELVYDSAKNVIDKKSLTHLIELFCKMKLKVVSECAYLLISLWSDHYIPILKYYDIKVPNEATPDRSFAYQLQVALATCDIETTSVFLNLPMLPYHCEWPSLAIAVRDSIFTWAFYGGNLDLIKALYTKYCELLPPANSQGNLNRLKQLLGIAVLTGNVKNVEWLLDQGIAIDSSISLFRNYIHNSFLSIAVDCNNQGMVELFLSRGADVNKANLDGSTPLHIATRNGYIQIISILLQHELQHDADIHLQDGYEKTAMDYVKECSAFVLADKMQQLYNRAMAKQKSMQCLTATMVKK
jgi:hypothetical protein